MKKYVSYLEKQLYTINSKNLEKEPLVVPKSEPDEKSIKKAIKNKENSEYRDNYVKNILKERVFPEATDEQLNFYIDKQNKVYENLKNKMKANKEMST